MSLYRSIAVTVAALGVVGGCANRESAQAAATHEVVAPRASQASAVDDPEVARWLDGLRNVTAPFRDTAAAIAAGWSARITGCLAMPGAGGMGFHYANQKLIDGTVQQFAPELLVYAPEKGGGLRLVAVEYIVPFSVRSADARPPRLHGIEFHRNLSFQLWALHAWIWQNNPAGVFADWNPEVTCSPAL